MRAFFTPRRLRSAALALWVLGVFSWEPTALMLPAVVWLLVPGYGAQGGTAADVKAAYRSDGLGAVSRAIASAQAA